MASKFHALDLFAGCGGLSEGMRASGFNIIAAIDADPDSAAAYKLNHPDTKFILSDIRKVQTLEINELLKNEQLHLLAGCPPCQGFSSMRRLNKKANKRDTRNGLILEYLRFVRELRPLTIMMENVPGLINYNLFKVVLRELQGLGYSVEVKITKIQQYGVPQRRQRLVLVGSLIGDIQVAQPSGRKVTVRDAIGHLDKPSRTADPLHQVISKHSPAVRERIAATPKNGGSRSDIPQYDLACHKRKNVGFRDVYGRLRWDDYSSTITGGCLNPSKGRFLHPVENRAISAREAALLQTFPKSYKFPANITKTSLALMIGNALPPAFSRIQSSNVRQHLIEHLSVGTPG